jgi:ATP-binding cassette subfamily B multidrug efflux pump
LVDWLNQSHPNTFLSQHAQQLLMLVAILVANIIFATMQSIIRHQILFSSFPMRLRWRFHNLMMQQSLDFFSNEFSGRLAAKIMQTALAVREFWVILGDIIAYVLIYFISISLMLGSVAPSLLIPLFVWLVLFISSAIFSYHA